MVVDTSALLAVFFDEPAAEALLDTIEHDDVRAISTASLLEASVVVLARKGADALESLEKLIAALRLDLKDFTDRDLGFARQGAQRFGKGRHPAALNFGDCFSYGLARALNEPLLFTGSNLAQTDVKRSL